MKMLMKSGGCKASGSFWICGYEFREFCWDADAREAWMTKRHSDSSKQAGL